MHSIENIKDIKDTEDTKDTGKREETFLIVKYSSLGDIINAVPAVRFLRSRRPEARIYWVVKEEFAPLLEGADFIDGTVVYGGGSIGNVRAFLTELRALNIDVSIDMQGIFRSGLISLLSCAMQRFCFQYTREFSSFFYTDKVGAMRGTVHAARENLSVVEGFLGEELEGELDFTLNAPDTSVKDALALIPTNVGAGGEVAGAGSGAALSAPLIIINPLTRWASKNWAPERFAELSERLISELGARVVFTGTAKDAPYIDDIIGTGGAVSLAGKTKLPALLALIKEADLMITGDSGPMHMASAAGTPVVAIFGPTDPSYTGPFSKDASVVSARVDCYPCRRRKCKDHSCMDDVSVEDVFSALKKFL